MTRPGGCPVPRPGCKRQQSRISLLQLNCPLSEAQVFGGIPTTLVHHRDPELGRSGGWLSIGSGNTNQHHPLRPSALDQLVGWVLSFRTSLATAWAALTASNVWELAGCRLTSVLRLRNFRSEMCQQDTFASHLGETDLSYVAQLIGQSETAPRGRLAYAHYESSGFSSALGLSRLGDRLTLSNGLLWRRFLSHVVSPFLSWNRAPTPVRLTESTVGRARPWHKLYYAC